MSTPVRHRAVRISWSRAAGLTITGTRYGDGTWAWLHERWEYLGGGVWRMNGSIGEDPDLYAVVLTSKQLRSIGVDVTAEIDLTEDDEGAA